MAARGPVFAYWIAVVMAAACLAIVALHHSSLAWDFEIGGVSLVWITAGGAILAVLVHELMDSTGRAERQRRVDRSKREADKETTPGRSPAAG